MLRTHENRYAEQLDMVYKGNRLTKVSKTVTQISSMIFKDIPIKPMRRPR